MRLLHTAALEEQARLLIGLKIMDGERDPVRWAFRVRCVVTASYACCGEVRSSKIKAKILRLFKQKH